MYICPDTETIWGVGPDNPPFIFLLLRPFIVNRFCMLILNPLVSNACGVNCYRFIENTFMRENHRYLFG